jgi:vanillate O-demethylase ferredoxin subunit
MADNTAFQIKIASIGTVIDVSPNDTIVDALLWHGIEIETSCEQGICGTCLTRVIEGTPDHRDAYLTPDEHAANDQMTLCCSRSKSALLVLDL